MKIDFSKVIFIMIIFSDNEGMKGLILFNSDVPEAKRKQQKSSSVMIWAGIVE